MDFDGFWAGRVPGIMAWAQPGLWLDAGVGSWVHEFVGLWVRGWVRGFVDWFVRFRVRVVSFVSHIAGTAQKISEHPAVVWGSFGSRSGSFRVVTRRSFGDRSGSIGGLWGVVRGSFRSRSRVVRRSFGSRSPFGVCSIFCRIIFRNLFDWT